MSIESSINRTNAELEKGPQLDFSQIFMDKLKTIKPREFLSYFFMTRNLEKVGITKVQRVAPAVIFFTGSSINIELWIEDFDDCDREYIHKDATKKLNLFLKDNNLGSAQKATVAFVIQDEQGGLHLAVDSLQGQNLQLELDEEDVKKYPELMRRYGIRQIIGKFEEDGTPGMSRWGPNPVKLLEAEPQLDLIGDKREEIRLLGIAQKYKMTNTQYMRFRILAKSASDSFLKGEFQGYPNMRLRDVEEIAKEVITEDKE